MNPKRQIPPVADPDGGSTVLAAYMDDDVLTEILLRLPAKSVTRFKLVCKSWLSIISSDRFRRLHTLRRHKLQPSLILHIPPSASFYFNPITNSEEKVMIPYNFSVRRSFEILSSCNGLLLLRFDFPITNSVIVLSPRPIYDHHEFTYVFNPTTKQLRKIIVNSHSKFFIEGLKLAFDSSKSLHYRIFCLWRKKNRTPYLYQIEVYESESCTWKLCTEPFIDSKEQAFSSGAYCNNSIFWKTYSAIKFFDIEKNAMGSLPHPEIPWREKEIDAFDYSQLQESNGHLYYFLIDLRGESVALWELQGGDYHSQWFLKFYDIIGHLPSTFGSRFDTTPLRFIRGSDGEETSFLLIYTYGKIRAYMFADKSFRELVDFSNPPFYLNYLPFQSYYQGLHQFGESLALV